jgi:hypothetical protein
LTLYENPELGDSAFDAVAGVGAPYLPVDLVKKQMRELKAAVGGIEHYVDGRVAHYDRRKLAQPTPKFGDLTNALLTLERLVILYSELLTSTPYSSLLPTFAYDWEEIFRFPWANPGGATGRERHLMENR